MGCGRSKPAADGLDAAEKEKFSVLKERWDVESKAIGEGGFGTVHLCKDLKTGKQRACKAMRLQDPLDREDFRHEVMIYKKIETHRNICHIIDNAEDARYGYLVMQSCTGGELFDKIAARKCNERDSAMAVLDVLCALEHLHSKQIAFRDLKPENLIYKDKEPGAPLKLIDFGLAVFLPRSGKLTEVCGTTSYMAPEVLKGNYALECDLWALGVITYFMLSGKLPFPGRTDDEKEACIMGSARNGISMPPRSWSEISSDAVNFIKSLLDSSVSKRLTGKQALEHPWITNRATLSDAPLSEEVANSLKKYADAHRFEKAIRYQMATHMTSAELHRLRNVFERLDTDGTGHVSIGALMETLKKDAADAKTAETLGKIDLANFDLDGDGQIDWQEFVAGAMTEHHYHNGDMLEKVFKDADVNGDGTLCANEIAKTLGGDEVLSREMLEEIAKERPGSTPGEVTLTMSEFKALMTKNMPPAAASAKPRRRHKDPALAKSQYAEATGETIQSI